MRVKSPGDGAPPISGLDETGATEATAPAGQASEAGRASQVGDVAKTTAAGATGEADPVGDVARRLRAGEISAKEAVELLIDDAVGRQVGRALADKQALARELKELLRRHAENDPYLASKVRRLRNRS